MTLLTALKGKRRSAALPKEAQAPEAPLSPELLQDCIKVAEALQITGEALATSLNELEPSHASS
jgi:hypothetical protein